MISEELYKQMLLNLPILCVDLIIQNRLNILNINQKLFLYVNITVFVLIEIICLSIILYISKLKGDLFQKIYNPLFVNNFIKKYDINTFNDRFNQEVSILDVELGNNFIINILEENSTSIDWIILNLTLYSKWMDFDFFGIKIQSINSIIFYD